VRVSSIGVVKLRSQALSLRIEDECVMLARTPRAKVSVENRRPDSY